MLKANTVDELLSASELCLAAAMTSPVPCLLEFAQRLVEYVLGHDNYLASINQNYATVLAKMLVRIIILVIWAEDRRKQNQRLKTQKRMSRKRKHPDESLSENPASVSTVPPEGLAAELHPDLSRPTIYTLLNACFRKRAGYCGRDFVRRCRGANYRDDILTLQQGSQNGIPPPARYLPRVLYLRNGQSPSISVLASDG